MSPHNTADQRSLSLPLTESSERESAASPRAAHGLNAHSIVAKPTESEIRQLVDTFYATIQTDAQLGPIFARHVKDWSLHLPKMYDFWSTVILRTGRYAGRPIEVHERIPELSRAHFDRWLSLWSQAVERVIPHAARPGFIQAAERMALSMSARLATP